MAPDPNAGSASDSAFDPGSGTDPITHRTRVIIDADAERYRYVCPNGHADWDRTNNHLWCRGCRRQADNGADVDPEHYRLFDKKREEVVPWEVVEIADRGHA